MAAEKIYENRMKPFKIIDDVYFSGTYCESSHLIDTGEGLIMIDTGDLHTLYLMVESIWELGFKPTDVKYILFTHWHYDHVGSGENMAELTGAKTFIGNKELPYLKEYGYFTPDVLLYDGDEIRLGNKVIKCIETPGHTKGTMSYIFDTVSNGKTYRVGMFGGAGHNTLVRTSDLKPYPQCRRDYLCSVDRLMKEDVDVFIGNHCWNNATREKAAVLAEGKENPFIDKSAWTNFLADCKKRCEELPEY